MLKSSLDLFLAARAADAAIVVLHLLGLMAAEAGCRGQRGGPHEGDVVHLAAHAAEEMRMGTDVGIEARIVFVDGEHLGRTMTDEETQRVIDSRLRERWHLGTQRLPDVVHRGVHGVMAEPVHDGQALGAQLDVMFLEQFDCIHF